MAHPRPRDDAATRIAVRACVTAAMMPVFTRSRWTASALDQVLYRLFEDVMDILLEEKRGCGRIPDGAELNAMLDLADDVYITTRAAMHTIIAEQEHARRWTKRSERLSPRCSARIVAASVLGAVFLDLC